LQAEFLVAYFVGLANETFKTVDREAGRARYGRALLNLGGVETAKSALADKEWEYFLNSDEGEQALFRAYLRAGRTNEAKALFDARSRLRRRYVGASSDESLFAIAKAVEYAKLGNIAGAVDAAGRLSSSADRFNVQQLLVNEAFDKSLTADEFDRQISILATLTWEDAEYVNRIIAWDYVVLGDPERATWTTKKFFTEKPDAHAIDYLISEIIELRRKKEVYRGVSSLIECAHSASMQATAFLQLADVR
jgi:hypothetical protein